MTPLTVVNDMRNCGICTACCTAKGVAELDKPGGTACRFIAQQGQGVGCIIYADRPLSCQVYKCMWLANQIDKKLKPNECGFVLDIDRETVTKHFFHCATPAWPNAFKDDKVLFRLKKLCKKLKAPIILHEHSIMAPVSHRWKKKLIDTFGVGIRITWVGV